MLCGNVGVLFRIVSECGVGMRGVAVGVDVKRVRDGVRCRHARIVWRVWDGFGGYSSNLADCRLWESFDGPYPLYLLAQMSRAVLGAGYWGWR